MLYTIYVKSTITSRGSREANNSLSTRLRYFEVSQTLRDEVVEKFSNLICVHVQCMGETRYIDVFALSDIIESILRGPAGRVIVTNHRRAITFYGTESGIIPMELASLNGAVLAKSLLRTLSTKIEV